MNFNFLLLILLIFATVILGIYYLVPRRWRYLVLLFASLSFYVIYSQFMTVFVLLTIITVYFAGININHQNKLYNLHLEITLDQEQKQKLQRKYQRRKKLICTSIALFNIVLLVILKYFNILTWLNFPTNSITAKIVIPLGISYYTLSAIGYIIDVYRGKYTGEKNFFKVALFILYFPQLIMGPFASFSQLAPQLYEGGTFESKRAQRGLFLILLGLVKKFVIADRLAIITTPIFNNYQQYHGLMIILAIISFTFQLYAEFSGIIDMVRGVSLLFGIELKENFRQPFFSQSYTEFWQRWHISLGEWLREYIFYPVALSKSVNKLTKKLPTKIGTTFQIAIALLFVWTISGLWHGVEMKYIVTIIYNFIIILLETILFNNQVKNNTRFAGLLNILVTFIIVIIGCSLLRINNNADILYFYKKIFDNGNGKLFDIIDIYDFAISIISVLSLLLWDAAVEHQKDPINKLVNSSFFVKCFFITVLLTIILIFGAYGDDYITPDPIYGRF